METPSGVTSEEHNKLIEILHKKLVKNEQEEGERKSKKAEKEEMQ